MLQALKRMYPSLCLLEEVHRDDRHKYDWFILDKQQVVGFQPNELREKEKALLEVFLTPYQQRFPTKTTEEEQWEKVLKTKSPHMFEGNYRFVFFSFDRQQLTPVQFKSAISAVFDKEIPVIWMNDESGVLIEHLYIHEEPMQYEEMIYILMNDLSAKLHIYVSQSFDQSADVERIYRMSHEVAVNILPDAKEYVLTYTTVLPYLLKLGLVEVAIAFKEMIVGDCFDDPETLKFIKTFMNCDLNVTETAKQLHLHRNSLQYRLEKFEKQTQLNIRKFQHALTAYLLYLLK